MGESVLAESLPHFRQTCYDCRLRRFDPLSLASEEKALTWFQQAELVHCRTAMTAVAGIIIPGVCTELSLESCSTQLVMVTTDRN